MGSGMMFISAIFSISNRQTKYRGRFDKFDLPLASSENLIMATANAFYFHKNSKIISNFHANYCTLCALRKICS